ncbi:hypothetical protein BDN71DRAFT_215271 [Pleurotus eryngii]|uniref:Uncharacterized protein n=1 Tax=Pleurotus eryngii TaxID=5323 RepID=A0A9P6D2M8_PLEER|nr:hypothetical protein BDN71DRAFT_215271 [Pleurotus eryngii]
MACLAPLGLAVPQVIEGCCWSGPEPSIRTLQRNYLAKVTAHTESNNVAPCLCVVDMIHQRIAQHAAQSALQGKGFRGQQTLMLMGVNSIPCIA